jgi:hypothetical protein
VLICLQEQQQPVLQPQPPVIQTQQQTQQVQLMYMQQSDSNLSAASCPSSGGGSDEHPSHSSEQVRNLFVCFPVVIHVVQCIAACCSRFMLNEFSGSLASRVCLT